MRKKLDLVKKPVITQVDDPEKVGPNYASLNERQRKFVEAYLLHGNAKQACQDAGYEGKYIAQNTSKFLNNPKIIEALKERQIKIKESVENPLTPEEMRTILAQMARNTVAKDSDRVKAIKLHAELDGLLIKRFEGSVETHHVLNSEDLERIEKDITDGLLTCEDISNVIDMD